MSATPYDPDEFDNNPFAEPSVPSPVTAAPEGEEQRTTTAPIEESTLETAPEAPPKNDSEDSKHSQTPHSSKSLLPERQEKDKYRITVKVTALERSGSLSNKKENPGVIFDLSTDIPHFRKKTYKSVKKSYHEFTTFWKFLNGANPECFVPALPLSCTNYGIQNEEDYRRTIQNFQIWFSRITANPIIIRNEEFVFFIESDFGTYSPVNKSKLPASGLKRKTLKQFQPPYDEVLELAELRPLIKSIYQNAKSITEKLDKLTKIRKQLAQQENDLGVKITELSTLENHHPGMQNMWKRVGKTITALGDYDSVLGSFDLATLGDGLQHVINDGYIIKEALTNRHLLMRDLITAQGNTKIKHENARKLRMKRDINPIKVDEAIRSLEEASAYEEKLTQKIKRITEEMLIEKQEYLKILDQEIKMIFKECVIRKIEYERRKLRALEKVRLDVRLVDENGGLARLGREAYPVTKAVSTSSQGPDGDSWSGDRKVSHITTDLLREEPEVPDIPEEEVPVEEEAVDEIPIDARNAASLLGGSTF